MKKIIVLAIAMIMTTGLLAGCASEKKVETEVKEETEVTVSESETAEEATDAEETTEERTQLIVGFDAEFPPYGFMDDNGEYVGFDLSLAQEVCDRNGWELVKQPIDWDAKDMELSSGSIDCIWNGFTINGREDAYTWSVPYVDNSQVFVVAADSGIASKTDLAGKTVVVQADSSALAALTAEEDNAENLDLAATFTALNQCADYNTAFMDLEAGAVDAVAMDIGVAKFQMASDDRKDKFVMLEDYLSTEQYGVGFLLGNDSLKDQVEATLLEMKADGTFDEIATEWDLADSVCLGE